MNVELRQLKHAVAVAEHGGFARAAMSLHLSQSALSRSVQALERAVGTPIFLRSASGVELTDIGRQLLGHGSNMLQVAAELDLQIVRNRSLQAGRLRIGIATATAEGAACDAAEAMLTDHPMAALEFRTGFRTDMLQPLRSGEIDVLVADSTMFPSDDPELELLPLEEHPLVVAVRRGHPLDGRPGVAMPDIFGYPVVAVGRLRPELLAAVLEQESHAVAVQARQRAMPAVVTNSTALAEMLLLQTDAVGALPPSGVAALVASGQLVPLAAPHWLTSPFGLVRIRARAPSPVAQAFSDKLAAAQRGRAALDRSLVRQWFTPAPPAV
jgi:DNA-binding transcriptional LysR family regulator